MSMLILGYISYGYAQNLTSDTFGRGLRVQAKYSSFLLKFGFRFQTLYQSEANRATGAIVEGLLIRRSRLKFEGYAWIQGGYLLPSNWKFAGRYTNKSSPVADVVEYTAGISRYVQGHNLKIQSDLSYQDYAIKDDQLVFRFQTELAF